MSLTDVRDNGGAAPDPDGLGIGISAVTLSGLDAATSTASRISAIEVPASLGDRVYIDADGDGVQDTNGLEPNLPGVQITRPTWVGLDGALGTTDDLTLTTTSGNPAASTDPNYLFQHLPAGDYQVSVSASGGGGPGFPAI